MKEHLRNEVDSKFKWDLEALLSENDIEKYKEEVEQLLQELISYKGHITDSADSLYNFYKLDEKLSRLVDKLYSYAHMKYDSDTTDSKSQKLLMEMEKLLEHISENVTFITPEILNNDYDKIQKFIEEDNRLLEYKFDLEQLFRNKPYILSEDKEQIITMATNYGLGTVPIGIANFLNQEAVLEGIGADKNKEDLLLVISIGYPDEKWKDFVQPKQLSSFVKYV